MKIATRLIVEEALEAESRDALGREYYEHGAKPGQGYRNGHRRGRLKTAEGFVGCAASQIAGREYGFRSEIREGLKGRTEALERLAVELLARGLSVRDIEDVFTARPSATPSTPPPTVRMTDSIRNWLLMLTSHSRRMVRGAPPRTQSCPQANGPLEVALYLYAPSARPAVLAPVPNRSGIRANRCF